MSICIWSVATFVLSGRCQYSKDLHGPQSWKHSLSGPLQREFAHRSFLGDCHPLSLSHSVTFRSPHSSLSDLSKHRSDHSFIIILRVFPIHSNNSFIIKTQLLMGAH